MLGVVRLRASGGSAGSPSTDRSAADWSARSRPAGVLRRPRAEPAQALVAGVGNDEQPVTGGGDSLWVIELGLVRPMAVIVEAGFGDVVDNGPGEIDDVAGAGNVCADQVVAAVSEDQVAVEADRQALGVVDYDLWAGEERPELVGVAVVAGGSGADHPFH